MEATTLDTLLFALEKTEKAILDELRRLYPIGTPVRVNLRYHQITPSEAIVTGHEGGRFGRVGVRLLNSQKHLHRSVAYQNIERGG